jgi:hypothetical protein
MNLINKTLTDIEVSDLPVISTGVNSNDVKILFSEIYLVEEKKYISNIFLEIIKWTELNIQTYIFKDAKSQPEINKIDISHFEDFDLIQEIIIQGNELILGGFSKKTGNWLEYIFKDYEYKLYEK